MVRDKTLKLMRLLEPCHGYENGLTSTELTIKQTPDDYVENLTYELNHVWSFLGIDYSILQRDKMFKFMTDKLNDKNRKSLITRLQLTERLVRHFLKHLEVKA